MYGRCARVYFFCRVGVCGREKIVFQINVSPITLHYISYCNIYVVILSKTRQIVRVIIVFCFITIIVGEKNYSSRPISHNLP